MTLEISTLLHIALHVGGAFGGLVLACDLLKLEARVARLDEKERAVERREAKEERVRHDETNQLRRDVDAVAIRLERKIARKRAHAPRPLKETLEAGFAPPRQPDDTAVFSPNAPKLPRFQSLDDPRHACACPAGMRDPYTGRCARCDGLL